MSTEQAATTAGEPQFRRADGRTGGAIQFIRATELNKQGVKGVVAQGTFEGTVKNSQSNKDDYKFRAANGDLLVVNNQGNLGSQMAGVTEGTLCRISYNGMKKMTKGANAGKSSHNFIVEIA